MRPAALILLAEADALPPILRTLEDDLFMRTTVLPGWTVRDVIAHCSAAMQHVTQDTFHGFSPADNEADVDDRRGWPISDLLDELASGYRTSADRIDAAGGRLDGLGLGEWIHGGDIRDALGLDDAYVSAGAEYAVDLIVERSVARDMPQVTVTVGARRFIVGSGDLLGTLETDLATLIRLVAGRNPDPAAYRLTGVDPSDLLLFR